MTDGTSAAERRLLEAALGQPLEARDAYLCRVCGGDTALKGRIEKLIHGHYNTSSMLSARCSWWARSCG
ncbi:MAG: hypothetical protein AAF628_37270 [Planctomycetota bacterium]